MRAVFLGFGLCLTCLAELEVGVPASAAHPQGWLNPEIRGTTKTDYQGKSAGSFAEFIAPEVITKIAVDQYSGPPDDVRRYLNALPTAAAQYFGPSLDLCWARPNGNGDGSHGATLIGTSTSTVTFESGRTGRLSVATVVVSRLPGPGPNPQKVFGLSSAPGCVGLDKVPVDSLYVTYVDPDGYRWSFAIPLQRKK